MFSDSTCSETVSLCRGELDVIHFANPPWMSATHVHYGFGTFENTDFKAQYRRIVRDQLQSMIRDATEYLPITINPIVLEAEKHVNRMLEYLHEIDVNLVVIGKTGKGSDHSNHALGTTAEYVVRRATCPVLIIPHTEANREQNT